MKYNKKIKNLIIILYPSFSLYASCKKCSKDLGYSIEMIYKTCINPNYKGRKGLFLLLRLMKERKIWKKKEKYLNSFLTNLTKIKETS